MLLPTTVQDIISMITFKNLITSYKCCNIHNPHVSLPILGHPQGSQPAASCAYSATLYGRGLTPLVPTRNTGATRCSSLLPLRMAQNRHRNVGVVNFTALLTSY